MALEVNQYLVPGGILIFSGVAAYLSFVISRLVKWRDFKHTEFSVCGIMQTPANHMPAWAALQIWRTSKHEWDVIYPTVSYCSNATGHLRDLCTWMDLFLRFVIADKGMHPWVRKLLADDVAEVVIGRTEVASKIPGEIREARVLYSDGYFIVLIDAHQIDHTGVPFTFVVAGAFEDNEVFSKAFSQLDLLLQVTEAWGAFSFDRALSHWAYNAIKRTIENMSLQS